MVELLRLWPRAPQRCVRRGAGCCAVSGCPLTAQQPAHFQIMELLRGLLQRLPRSACSAPAPPPDHRAREPARAGATDRNSSAPARARAAAPHHSVRHPGPRRAPPGCRVPATPPHAKAQAATRWSARALHRRSGPSASSARARSQRGAPAGDRAQQGIDIAQRGLGIPSRRDCSAISSWLFSPGGIGGSGQSRRALCCSFWMSSKRSSTCLRSGRQRRRLQHLQPCPCRLRLADRALEVGGADKRRRWPSASSWCAKSPG